MSFPSVIHTAMITGHRPELMTAEEIRWSKFAIRRTLDTLDKKYQTRVAISGMARGADTWWATYALDKGMSLHAYIPFKEQAKGWSDKDFQQWKDLLLASDKVEYVGDVKYDVRMLHARNRAMLNATKEENGLVVALLKSDVNKGGTWSAVSQAQRMNLNLLVLDPVKREFIKHSR